MSRHWQSFLFAATFVALFGCNRTETPAPASPAESSQPKAEAPQPATVASAAENAPMLSPVEGADAGGEPVKNPKVETRISGLQVMDAVIGKGVEAKPGNRVTLHYTGWLEDGRPFDASRPRGEPFVFRIGARQVVPGFEEGVAGMRVGGRRRVIIPSHLGYGERGAGNGLIPPNATLIFELELLSIK